MNVVNHKIFITLSVKLTFFHHMATQFVSGLIKISKIILLFLFLLFYPFAYYKDIELLLIPHLFCVV